MTTSVLNKSHETLDQKEILKLIKKWQNDGDREARKKVIEQNIKLVKSVIMRFSGSGVDKEDLIQIGLIGLVKAVDRFDTKRNVKFSTYAVPLIIGEIKTFLRDDHPIKISRNLTDLFKKAKEVRRWLTLKLRREPTVGEVAKELEVTREELVAAEEANQSPVSLDKPINDSKDENQGDQKLLLDTLPDTHFDNIIFNKLTVQETLKKLDKQERQLIVLRYYMEKSQGETGRILGLTQVQVSRMEKRILNYLKEYLKDPG
ncbi:sigma-70 family RNA polymerase sigma factor [Natranaerobius trueperi]|uniref:RNA polymerase sigma factor n=1 Tax=Natranaerobius trueperi TaxID=759412 RepID=A0A226BYY0_9FIRM|nr:sigma-70 family RNA polymerase sigma factor [Natranaerobius trueperi]OWZ83982.1 RNA polymerase sigma-G factor [Natranaerobius trueperi]